jgi:hypothetical protein
VIRTKEIEGITYYCVFDIGKTAGISNIHRDVRPYEKTDMVKDIETKTKGGMQLMRYISLELYDIVLRKQEKRETKREKLN